MSKIKIMIRKIVAILLLGFHSVPTAVFIANPLIGMIYPIAIEWLLISPWSPFHYFWETRWLLFDKVSLPIVYGTNPNPIVGWSVFTVGFLFFLIAFVQFLRKRKEDLVKTGLYSKVRHPQYLGIILATLGFTFASERPMAWIAWINMVFLYLLLASSEEKIMLERHKEQFRAYIQEVPFIFPFLWFSISESKFRKYLFVLLTYVATMIIAWMILKQFSYNPGPFWT